MLSPRLRNRSLNGLPSPVMALGSSHARLLGGPISGLLSGLAAIRPGADFIYENPGVYSNWLNRDADIKSSLETVLKRNPSYDPNSIVVSIDSGFFTGITLTIKGTVTKTFSTLSDLLRLIQSDITQVVTDNKNQAVLNYFNHDGLDASFTPGAAASSDTASQPGPSAESYGIQYVLSDPNNNSDYDVIYTDGGSGVFNSDGTFYAGENRGITTVQLNDDGSGFQVQMNDGALLYFDLSGALFGYTPAGGFSNVVKSGGNVISAAQALTNALHPALTAQDIALAVKAQQDAANKSGGGAGAGIGQQISDFFGGFGVPFGLGATGGVILFGALYYFLTTTAKGRR